MDLEQAKAIANGVQDPPQQKINLKPQDVVILAVTDTIIGACNFAGAAISKFGLEEPAQFIERVTEVIAAYGKGIVERAAAPELLQAPNMAVAGHALPSARDVQRQARVIAAMRCLRDAASILRGEN